MKTLEQQCKEAQTKAIKSLAAYKFVMFGYWAGVWVHLNKMRVNPQPNPFKGAVMWAKANRAN